MKDLKGLIFGKLTVQSFDCYVKAPNGEQIPKWNCICECGKQCSVRAYSLTRSSGSSKSCGCLGKQNRIKINTKHGKTGSPTYVSWQTMVQRCTNPSSPEYERYMGDSIVVCNHWLSDFSNFLEDMGERPEGTSLNRINGAKIYSKETCEWATLSVQAFDQKKSVRNTSGNVGVYYNLKNSKWYSRIHKNKITYNLGSFYNKEDAIAARKSAELKLYGFNRE